GLLAERGHQGELVDAELSDQHDDERLLLLLGQLSGLGNIRLGRQSGIDRDLCERLWQTIPSAPDKIRTCDLWLRRPTLYPAELRVRRGTVYPPPPAETRVSPLRYKGAWRSTTCSQFHASPSERWA